MTEVYTPEERQNIVGDITRWKVELEEVGGGDEFPADELDAYVEWLYTMDDAELRSMWDGSVAEWVASRQDMPPAGDGEMSESWLDAQFEALRRGDGVPWGYVTWVEVPPESEVNT
jgi:hypothetical protein